jgi:hypothetical protein
MTTLAHGKNARVYYDFYKMSDFANAWDINFTQDAAETTAFEDAGKTYVPGKYGHSGSVSGFIDVSSGGFDTVEFADLVDGEHLLLRLPQGTTQGYAAYETNELNTGTSRAAEIGNVWLLNWSGQGTDRAMRGAVLSVGEQAITATGNTTGLNYGIQASTATVVVTLRVLSVSGMGSVTFLPQGSSDNGAGDAYAAITGWTLSEVDPGTNVNIGTADQATFTGIGLARFTRTGATEAWMRINVSAFSGFTSVTLLATVTTKA